MKVNSTPRLLLVDSHALIHRAYHALPPTMTNEEGVPTNAVFGFTNALMHAIDVVQPDYVLCCFDMAGPTHRHLGYAEYKAHRKPLEEGLSLQLPYVVKVVEALNIPMVQKQGFEADDLIGTLARKFKSKVEVVIITGDKDTFQLIDDHVTVMTMKQGQREPRLVTLAEFEKEYGFPPHEFIMFKALCGDTSDNIPGVRGIGEVTAIKLVQNYHSLDRLFAALQEPAEKHPLIKPAVRTALADSRQVADLSYRLATIDCQVPLKISLADSKRRPPHAATVQQVFTDLNFKSLLTRLNLPTAKESHPLKPARLVNRPKVEEGEASVLALLEMTDQPLAISFQSDDHKISRIGVATKTKAATCVWNKTVASGLAKRGSKSHAPLVMRGARQLLSLLKSELISLNCPLDDVNLIEQLLEDKVIDKDDLPPGDAAVTLVGDYITAQLHLKQANLDQLWQKIEQPLTPILWQMEELGVKIDRRLFSALSTEFAQEISQLEHQVWSLAGKEFNLASPHQLREILFETLQIGQDGVKKKKTGLSTDAETLEGLKHLHPVIALILQYRELTKLYGTYIQALPKLVDQHDRLHTTYNQLGAATGRISSAEPNLQNIPHRGEKGDQIRRGFITNPGCTLVSVDYSQIELRILAHLADDAAMIDHFKAGHDIHTATAALLYRVKTAEVTSEMRRAAKVVNFGILYGLSAHRLSGQLGSSYHEAQEFINRYFATYPKIQVFLDEVVKKVQQTQEYYTMFGRRRIFADINSKVWALRSASERMARNFPMQGAQADILKMAMVAVDRQFQSYGPQVKLILTVHDELVLEVEDDLVPTVSKALPELMTSVCQLKVPLEVEIKCGPNWADMQPQG